MYEVDPKTLLFSNKITWVEARELSSFCRDIITKGYTDMLHPAYTAWLDAYMKTINSPEDYSRMAILTYSAVFPQRALLSLVSLLVPDMLGVAPLMHQDLPVGNRFDVSGPTRSSATADRFRLNFSPLVPYLPT